MSPASIASGVISIHSLTLALALALARTLRVALALARDFRHPPTPTPTPSPTPSPSLSPSPSPSPLPSLRPCLAPGEIYIQLEDFIRDIDNANQHRQTHNIHLVDVVLSLRQSGSVIAGTGRIGTVLKRSIRAPHLENSDLSQAGSSSAAANLNDWNESDGTRAAWEPLAVAARAEQRTWWESRNEDNEATSQRLLLRERHELMIPFPSEDATTLPAEADNVGRTTLAHWP